MKPSWFWFAAALLAAGIPWWVAPYNRFTFSHPVSMIGFLAFVVIAAWAGGWTPFGVGRATLITGSAVPSAVMARVVVEGMKDPTSHNLWPFEVVMAAAFGFGLAFSCVLAGRLLRRMLGPE
ncbi:hypothetical protein [Geothrix sp.]|jgi:hypothetical protein|uniref:hypothetical protein n=1 Tax=Geothrix sp. TaxID=1962974 RepID=UPI0025C70677|nr:hypothetical protein [Geothrix sp.]